MALPLTAYSVPDTGAEGHADAVVVKKISSAPAVTRLESPVDTTRRSLPAGSRMLREVRQRAAAPKSEATFSASIAVEGMGESVTYYQENFNAGAIPAGWEIAPTQEVTWNVSTPSASHAFAEDPDDGGSLVQETPFQVFKREKSWAVSPAFTIGRKALLEFWIGFSLNYEDTSSLKVQVSDDNFETCTDLWFSREQQGEKPWQWRKIQVSLADFAGKTVKLRFFYGSGTGDELFDSGGYMGDYRIDNIRVYGPGSVESISLTTGEKVRFVADTDAPDGARFAWSFPGATPSESTESSPEVYYTADGDYDVVLTVTSGTESVTDTREALVHVVGTEPVAAIGYPATFRHNESGRKIMVAPMVPVKFIDASGGYPSSWSWSFGGISDDNTETATFTTPEAEVSYKYLHEWPVSLEVANSHGTSSAEGSVVAEYDGNITNMRPGDTGTNFDLEGSGTFPGSNTMGITAYAERFSAPSRPMRVYGAYVFFTKALASSVYYQIQDVKVKLCKADENGLPGEELDWNSWRVFELETPSGNSAIGTGFEFTDAPFVDSDFYIVVEGIPALTDNTEEQCDVRMAMSPFRTEGNSALFLKDGKWVEASAYFPAPANHTSYMIMVSMAHSVICNLPGTDNVYTVPADAGKTNLSLYSYLGWKPGLSSTDVPWLHITGEPSGITLDEVEISYDASQLNEPREGHVTFSDGASSHTFTVIQSAVSALKSVSDDAGSITYDAAAESITVTGNTAEIYNVYGTRVGIARPGTTSLASLPGGVYVAKSATNTLKFAR